MDKKTKLITLAVVGVVALAYGTAYYAGAFGPRNYGDCLIKNSAGDRYLVINACREMFPEDFSDLINPFPED